MTENDEEIDCIERTTTNPIEQFDLAAEIRQCQRYVAYDSMGGFESMTYNPMIVLFSSRPVFMCR
jgi:hypothetical protein